MSQQEQSHLHAGRIGTASFRVLDTFERRVDGETCADFKRRLASALDQFPALDGETVTVGCRKQPENTDYSRGWNPYASAEPVNRIIRVPTHERCTNVTLYHELAHCAIKAANEAGADHPETSEEFCSLYAVARQPPGTIDEDRIPYIGEPGVPAGEWPRIAREVLEYREDHRNYIQKAKAWYEVGDS